MWGGAAQFLLTALVLTVQFKHYFIAQSQQMAPHMGGVNSCFILFQSFFCTSALRGAVPFIGGLVTAEIVPSLLVFLFFKLSASTSHSIRKQRVGAPVTDAVEWLPDIRIRIAAAALKAGWNSSVTIGMNGQWFEVEREEHAQPPRPYVYVLRPAPPGKILRGYQEYPAAAALETVALKVRDTGLS